MSSPPRANPDPTPPDAPPDPPPSPDQSRPESTRATPDQTRPESTRATSDQTRPESTRPHPAPSVPSLSPDVPGLLRALLTADPGRPRVTWYGPGGERTELSAKVLDNWVAKSANLLVDEVDAGPGSAVLVDLPGHWRTLAWLLAVWAAGAAAVLPALPPARVPEAAGEPPAAPTLPAGLHPDAVLTDRPHRWSGTAARSGTSFAGASVLAVALPALATRFPADLPPGALDTAQAVRGQGDVFVPVVRPVPADPALVTADGTVIRHGELLAGAAHGGRTPGGRAGVRVLTGSGPDQVLTGWLPALMLGGSLVLHHDLAGLDTAARDRLVAQERVDVLG